MERNLELVNTRKWYLQRLYEIRLRLNISIVDVSNYVGISVNNMYRIEKGLYSPSFDVILKILEYYHFHISFSYGY